MATLRLTNSAAERLRSAPEFTKKWIEGLRSGKYTQNRGYMCSPDVPNSACCLHVMELECNGAIWSNGIEAEFPSYMPNCWRFDDGFLPEHLEAVTGDRCYCPDAWNDSLELTFNQIADLLEKGEVELDYV